MKTKTTNSLKAETVDNRLLAKQSISRQNQSCCSWEPNKKLIRQVADGTVRKRNQERLETQKLENITGTDPGSDDEVFNN